MLWTIPNILTLLRLASLPVLILLFFIPTDWAVWGCLTLYVAGALTDFFDGWLARKYEQVSEFGKFLDPIADKIFVVTILLMLIATDRVENVWVLCVVVILIREFIVAGLREYLGPQGIKLPVTHLAKWKTASQMLAIAFLILGPVVTFTHEIGLILLLIASVLTLITGWMYLKSGLKYIIG